MTSAVESTVEPLSEAESAFWVFFEAAGKARLNASDCARILGTSRSNWYYWINRNTKPYDYHIGRFRRATKHLNAALAERTLPAMTSAKRRAIVLELVERLNEGTEV